MAATIKDMSYRVTHNYRHATDKDLENWTLVCASIATLGRMLRNCKPVKIAAPRQGLRPSVDD